MPRTKDQVGNNSVCWESGESSNLVQRFLNTVHERELKQSIYQVISLQTWKKVSAMPFLFSTWLDGTGIDASVHQASYFHVLSGVIKEFHFRNYIIFLEMGKSVNIFKILLSVSLNKYSNGRKKWWHFGGRWVPGDKHTSWCSCFDEERIATRLGVFIFHISSCHHLSRRYYQEIGTEYDVFLSQTEICCLSRSLNWTWRQRK